MTSVAVQPLVWRVATIAGIRDESDSARSLLLDVAEWPGHLAGQHIDVRLIAEDGYAAQRSYSLASDPSSVEITVQRVAQGEVSSYLCNIAEVGDQFQLRGPVGGYFTWHPGRPEPVLLVAGGSGIVPLMAMIRTRAAAGSRSPFRLVYSVRDPDSVIYRDELARRVRDEPDFDVTYVYTRRTPTGWSRRPARLDGGLLAAAGWPAQRAPACFVCGPTGFVELAANLLVAAGHAPGRIRTERFG